MEKRFISLATRNALVYFFLFAIGLVLSSILFFSYSSTEILDLTQKRLKHTEEMVQLKFGTYLDQLERDLNQLSYSPLLDSYLNQSDTVYLDLLTKEYQSFLKTKPNYFQIRLISAAADGKEIIRVESKVDQIITCPKEELQLKGNRDYFKEINALPFDSLYISKIDLNKEYGEIALPRVPTLRIGKKIRGLRLNEIMLVINVDLNGVFEALKELLPSTYELRVLNQDGDYLIHPDPKEIFTFEYGEEPYYMNEYEFPLKEIDENGISVTDEIAVNHFFQLKYPRQEYKLFGVVTAKKEAIFASFYDWRNRVVVATIAIAIIFLLIAFIYMRRQSKDLSNITKRLTQFSTKMEPSKMDVNRKDEIGELAKSFEKMSAEIYQSHNEVAKAKDEAERAFKEKNEFLENMSHEIRNPLQSILGVTAILEQNKADKQQKPFIDSLKFSAIQLNSLVTDVLDYGKIKKGQIQLSPEWNDLEEFCNALVNASLYEANRKNIVIQFHYDDSLKAYLFKFDSVRIYQILNNLLNNALKFTPQSGLINLVICFEQNKVHFAINDTGPGISEEDLLRILNRSVGSNYTTGSGLGLTIVQELIHLHQAKLHVKSTLGEGTTFDFVLELDCKLKEQSDLHEVTENLFNHKDLNILVVEDDLELLNWYSYIFSHFRLTTKTSLEAVKGSEAPFDFVISDVNFEEKAVSVAEIEKAVQPYMKPNGRLIIVSGQILTLNKSNVKSLLKPIKKEEIYNELSNYLQEKEHGQLKFVNLENDYDQNKSLVKKALIVLISEWQRDSTTLKVAILNRDQERFDAVKHRIITSVRRLEINAFEYFLNTINLNAPQENLDDKAILIQEKFQFYIQEMRNYVE
ncbi:MAG: HAMP domain-containing protein [Crocinitomix sp.]|nr:HAMP domain-containing protein [Crocinitomix sp.]